MEQKRLPVFAERFAELRGEMTQGDFAEYLGISRPTVGFYENGTRLPDALVLRQIAEKCKVSADWLLGLSNFHAEHERMEANDLYNRLMELMPLEFDECDKKRVYQVLSTVIEGFRAAMQDYTAYTWYENATIFTTEALTAVVSCMEIAVKEAETLPEGQDDLFEKIDEIITSSSTSAYRELGYFFNAYRNAILEVLNAHDRRVHKRDFVFKVESLKNTDRK